MLAAIERSATSSLVGQMSLRIHGRARPVPSPMRRRSYMSSVTVPLSA